MGCLKCGRETVEAETFCRECQKEMAQYPVRPGTAVFLPKHRDSAPRKAPKRRGPVMEDQVKQLKKQVRMLAMMLLAALLIIVLLAIPAAEHLFGEHERPGQNYSTVTNSAAKNP